MSTTNHTTNYELSQYIGTDVTSYLSNYNSDMFKIDAQMKVNATAAANAQSDASAAVSAATAAASSASTAVSTANAANTAAEAAQTAATAAQTAAGTAQTDASAALRASASNTIGNLAPAYDPTLTYAVGDLVTYVDPETNQGKLYKNIIPIAVPEEEFNINKWDDVTTSEVYTQPSTLIASFETDGTYTNRQILDSLMNGVTPDKDSEYLLLVKTSSSTTYFHSQLVSTDGIYMFGIGLSTGGFKITELSLLTSDSSGSETVVNGNGITSTSITSTTPTARTYELYKLTTV